MQQLCVLGPCVQQLSVWRRQAHHQRTSLLAAHIAGTNAADVEARLGNNSGLFLRLFKRLLAEFRHATAAPATGWLGVVRAQLAMGPCALARRP